MAITSKKPAPAPSRADRVEPIWINVGAALPDYEDWQFAIRPEVSMEMLDSVFTPLKRLADMQNQVPEPGATAADSLIEDFNQTLVKLNEGLSKVIVDWNFISEDSGQELPSPKGHPELLMGLEIRLISAMGGLVVGYMSGTPPNSSVPSSSPVTT